MMRVQSGIWRGGYRQTDPYHGQRDPDRNAAPWRSKGGRPETRDGHTSGLSSKALSNAHANRELGQTPRMTEVMLSGSVLRSRQPTIVDMVGEGEDNICL